MNAKEKNRVLVVGSGGREHCIVYALSKSPLVERIYCAPGNGGTSLIAENIDIAADDIRSLLDFAKKTGIGLTVVGPEAPLVDGIVDIFKKHGLKIFGPGKDSAMLEGSKIFAKELMSRFGIPTAKYEVCNNIDDAKRAVEKFGIPVVVKADGLAQGKGVIVARTINEAHAAIDEMMVVKKFGQAGSRVIVEECLCGQEVSVLLLTDGANILPLFASTDHKRAHDGDRGPNTGGMGAYCPSPLVTSELDNIIRNKVSIPLIRGLKKDSKIYTGMLYLGLMIKDNVPYVLEFNVRFGDPETQAVLPKLKSDLFDLMLKTTEGRLDGVRLQWDNRFCISVVLASGGYPGSYEKGKEIKGLDDLSGYDGVYVFHAGTKAVFNDNSKKAKFFTDGGRVLNVSALGNTVKEAQDKAYGAISKIRFENMYYRRDIGNKALEIVPKQAGA
ncbi:MAG: phosphoribosylamine--glycine ligase [Candidatus Omnitrophota bacterium]